eukprot:m.6101 g.6101  ORF g.6101 m.6101 type:complete len:308 (+) comp2545_c0_seq2:78-1001(+)
MSDEDTNDYVAPGSFYELSYGRVHYVLTAPGDDISKAKELCVCIHGFSTEASIYEGLTEKLLEQGHAVLAIDLYGRGFSDAAPQDVPNTVSLFTSCISELLYSLAGKTGGLSTKPVTLVGYSMGGAIVAQYARIHPSFVNRVIFLAPAGLPVQVPFTARIIATPFLGEALFNSAGKSSMMKHISGGFHDQDAEGVQEAIHHFRKRTKYLFENHNGYALSLLSTLRHFNFGGHSDAFAALGQSGKPTLFVWGKNDTVVPFANLTKMLQLIPQAEDFPLSGCGHSDILGTPETALTVYERICSFIESSS